MKISETLQDYNAYLVGTLGMGTCKIYLRALNRFIAHTGNKDVNDLRLQDFTTYKMSLATNKKAPSYIAGELSALCSYLEFARKSLKLRPVDVEDIKDLRPKVRAGEPTPLETWQYSALLENTTAIEDLTLLVVLFNTGLRISEALSLTKNNIIERDMPGEADTAVRVRWVKVIGKGGKERTIPLNKEADEALTRYMAYLDLKFPKGYVKLFKGSYTMAWRKIKAIGKAAGIEVHPHMLRHTFATELLKRGENIVTIGKIMGHESLDTTRKYTKLADIAMVKAVERLG